MDQKKKKTLRQRLADRKVKKQIWRLRPPFEMKNRGVLPGFDMVLQSELYECRGVCRCIEHLLHVVIELQEGNGEAFHVE